MLKEREIDRDKYEPIQDLVNLWVEKEPWSEGKTKPPESFQININHFSCRQGVFFFVVVV